MAFKIQNDGQRVVATDYWRSAHAATGYAYLSGNAGALRLLVPRLMEPRIKPDMLPARRIVIEAVGPGQLSIVFDDDTEAPFVLTMSTVQTDRALSPGAGIPFVVYTESGEAMRSIAEVVK